MTIQMDDHFPLLDDEQMSNKVGVEHQPVNSAGFFKPLFRDVVSKNGILSPQSGLQSGEFQGSRVLLQQSWRSYQLVIVHPHYLQGFIVDPQVVMAGFCAWFARL